MGSADVAARMETIRVRVRFLSALRDRVGTSESVLVLPTGCTLHQVSQRLLEAYGLDAPSAQVMATLNGHGWAQAAQDRATELMDGDVICLFPPVSGG
jgi:molybdopterin converting factor small subunit